MDTRHYKVPAEKEKNMKRSSVLRNISITTASAILLGGIALPTLTPQIAWAQEASVTLPNVTLNVKDKPIHDVLVQLFKGAKVDFGIDPAVKGRVTVNLKNIPFENALKMILRLSATPITYIKEGGVYVVKPGTLATLDAVPARKVTLDIKEVSLQNALEELFRNAKIDYSIDPAVQEHLLLKRESITISANDALFEDALKMVLRFSSTPITYTKEKDGYRIKLGSLPGEPEKSTPTVSQANPFNVTLDLKDTPLRAALEQLFRMVKVDYSIDPSVQGYVNLKVTDMPFENALKLILRSSSTPLTYLKDSGVYMVKPRTLSASTPPPPALALADEVPPKNSYDRIELTYADPVDLAQILNITMIPIYTRFGLNVPGASGIARPGARNGGTNPGAPTPGSGRPGTGMPSPPPMPGSAPGGGIILGL